MDISVVSLWAIMNGAFLNISRQIPVQLYVSKVWEGGVKDSLRCYSSAIHFLFEIGSLISLELYQMARLAVQWTSRCPSLPPLSLAQRLQVWTMAPGFILGAQTQVLKLY